MVIVSPFFKVFLSFVFVVFIILVNTWLKHSLPVEGVQANVVRIVSDICGLVRLVRTNWGSTRVTLPSQTGTSGPVSQSS